MDALLKALFSAHNMQLNTYEDFKPEQLLAAQYGPQGAAGGTPYGLWGAMFGDAAPPTQNLNPLKDLAPSGDPLLTALLNS